MKRRTRVALSGAMLLGGIVVVLLLTSLGSRSQGPIDTALARVGLAVSTAEHALRSRFGPPGRSADLAWFEAYRADTARLRRPDATLLGAFDSRVADTLEGVVQLESSLGTTFPLVHVYTAWGDKPEEKFPAQLVTAIWDMGSVPVITWEPWLTDFESGRHLSLPLREARERHGLVAVARGDYDFYVDEWAREAARFGKPLFLRFGHEMNDPYRYPWGPQNNSNKEFIDAWRHVVARFRAAGAQNVLWVWSPHVAYAYWETYYPGNDYVDWVATGALNFGSVARWSQWWTFRDIFGTRYQALAGIGKPVMIAEFGSLAIGGDRVAWYRDALDALPKQYPAVKALLFFNATSDQTVTYQQVDWSIGGDAALTRAVAAAIRPLCPPTRKR